MRNDGEIFVLLSIGANLGDKKRNVKEAFGRLKEKSVLKEPRMSSFYLTEPNGYKDQPWFINVAVSGFTSLSPINLLKECKKIEKEIGRVNRGRWKEREIDIDILLYGDAILSEAALTAPHKRMHERRFVLVPAAEIAGGQVHPKLKLTIRQLLANCPDKSIVETTA